MHLATLILMLLAHAALFAVSVPLARRRIRPNALYGFRTPKTLSSERVWYDSNAYFGRVMGRTMSMSAGAQLLAFALTGPAFPLWGAMILTVASLIAVIKSFFYLSNL